MSYTGGVKPLSLLLLFGCVCSLDAEVKISPLKDRVRVEIEGRLFTEWRFKDWMAPYFYPVIGPNGESITRHYPMKAGVKGESQDHAHHRQEEAAEFAPCRRHRLRRRPSRC